jgi:hypothetical protein
MNTIACFLRASWLRFQTVKDFSRSSRIAQAARRIARPQRVFGMVERKAEFGECAAWGRDDRQGAIVPKTRVVSAINERS